MSPARHPALHRGSAVGRKRIGLAYDRPSHLRSLGEQIEPGNRVAMALLAGHQLERLLQAVCPIDVRRDPWRGKRLGLDGRLQDHACEPHAAERCVEQLGVGLGRDLDAAARRGAQRKRDHMAGHPPVAVVVLAVDVARDGASERHVSRAGDHGQREAVGGQAHHELGDRRTGLRGDEPRPVVYREDAIPARHVQHVSAVVLSRIAVAASGAPRDHAGARRHRAGEKINHVLHAARRYHPGSATSGPPPPAERLLLADRRRARGQLNGRHRRRRGRAGPTRR